VDIQSNWRRKDEAPPLSTDPSQLVPPTLALPPESEILAIFFIPDIELIEMEYVEKHIVVENMNREVQCVSPRLYGIEILYTEQGH
jgi:hypothetical protein